MQVINLATTIFKINLYIMLRSAFIRSTVLSATGILLFNKQLAASFFNQPAYKIKMLTDNIGIFTERGGTILFCMSKKGIAVVDSQFPEQAQHLISEIKNKTTKPFKYLINTHHHGDHTGGNIAFKDMVAFVVAHANSLTNQKIAAEKNKNDDKQLYPTITYKGDVLRKRLGKETIALHYFGAGHTNGDSLVHFERANIVHMGDLMFNRRHPFVDKTAGANIASWIKVLDKAISTFDSNTQFICGHAASNFDVLAKADDLKLFGDYLGDVLKFVEGEIKAGKTKEEIIKNKSMPNVGEWVGDGFERPLTAAYTELTTL
jgi:cyclase